MTDPDIRRRLSLHEAAHATVAHVLGYDVHYVSVALAHGGGMRVVGQSIMPIGHLLAVLAAGAVAERLWGYPAHLGRTDDGARMNALTDDLGDLVAAELEAHLILTEHRHAHGMLAVELNEKGYMGRDEVGFTLAHLC